MVTHLSWSLQFLKLTRCKFRGQFSDLYLQIYVQHNVHMGVHVCVLRQSGLRTKSGGEERELDKAEHGVTTPPQQTRGRPNYQPNPYKHTPTT